MSLARRLVSQLSRRPAAPPDDPPSGDAPYATGDQGASNALTLGGTGLADYARIGVIHVPVIAGAASLGTSSIEWRDEANATDAISTNRLISWGPYWLPAGARLVEFKVYGRGGSANAGNIRMALYTDDGAISTSSIHADTSYPVNWVAGAVTAEATISVGEAEGWITLAFPANISIPSDGFFWFSLWPSNWTTPDGPEFLTNGAASFTRRARTASGGSSAYSSSADPRATMPAVGSMTTSSRKALQAYLVYEEPAPGTIASVTATAYTGARGAGVAWAAATNATHYLVARSTNSGSSYSVIGAAAALALPDADCPAGSGVRYRVTPVNGSRPGTPVESSVITVGGVRVAHATATPTAVSATTRLTPRPLAGIHGNKDAPTFTRLDWYKRYNHATFEPTLGTYQLGALKTDLDGLNGGSGLATGQRYGIRIRWADDNNFALPSNTPADRRNGTSPLVYPNWSSDEDYWLHPTTGRIPLMLNEIAALNIRTGVTLADDPRFVWLEFGTGTYGENAQSSGAESITTGGWTKLLNAFKAAFPNKKFIVPIFSQRDTDDEAMAWETYNDAQVIGLRADGYGDNNAAITLEGMYGIGFSQRVGEIIRRPEFVKFAEPFTANMADARWQRATLEGAATAAASWSDANYADYDTQGAAGRAAIDDGVTKSGYRWEVTALHYPSPIVLGNESMVIRAAVRNVGWAPYPQVEQRYLQVQLRQSGAIAWSANLDGTPLNDLVPGGPPLIIAETVTITGIAAGTYDVCVQVPGDTALGLSACALAITGVQSGTYYILGSVTVSAP